MSNFESYPMCRTKRLPFQSLYSSSLFNFFIINLRLLKTKKRETWAISYLSSHTFNVQKYRWWYGSILPSSHILSMDRNNLNKVIVASTESGHELLQWLESEQLKKNVCPKKIRSLPAERFIIFFAKIWFSWKRHISHPAMHECVFLLLSCVLACFEQIFIPKTWQWKSYFGGSVSNCYPRVLLVQNAKLFKEIVEIFIQLGAFSVDENRIQKH